MEKSSLIKDVLKEQGLMPLFFHPDPAASIAVVRALYNGGVRIIEYTNRGEAALTNFKALKFLAEKELPGLYLGIGTIKTKSAAKAFIDAGADFLVSPAFSKKVHKVAKAHDLLWIPGCMTPTEVLSAEAAGLTLVKLFPGNVLGAGYVSAIRDLFPNMQFMPTGGVETTEENLRGWFGSGVTAVGMGSKLISSNFLSDRNYEGITSATISVLKTISQVKSNL